MNKIPVILDTDIGQDIDDTWAIAFMLNCPELDIKLIVASTQDTLYRAELTAKLLITAGRTDIPVGIGPKSGNRQGAQKEWLKDFTLDDYPGTVYSDGAGALIDAVYSTDGIATIISIGPLTTIAEALKRDPGIARKARFAGMQGCIRNSHEGMGKAIPEWNIMQDIEAARQVFTAPWEMTITPLDTCAFVKLDPPRYRKIAESDNPVLKAVIENYRYWLEGKEADESSILYDTVAIFLAFSSDWLRIERLPLLIDEEGYTCVDSSGKMIACATEWKYKEAFLDFLTQRLLS